MTIGFAHRGASSEIRENTLAAFARALELGASGLESDVRAASDGTLVLVHDAAIRRGFRRHRISKRSPADLAALEVPTLAGLFDALGADYELSLDVKDVSLFPAVIDAVSGNGNPARKWLCHPDLDTLAKMREQAGDVRLVWSTARQRLDGSFERHVANAAEAGADVINLHQSEWTPGLVSLVHRFELRCFAWDAQQGRELRGALECGVDAVYSDHVERMMKIVEELG